MNQLGGNVVPWLESRGINPETAARLGCYSGRPVGHRDSSGRWIHDGVVADDRGNVFCCPVFEHGQEVNVRYRNVSPSTLSRPEHGKGIFGKTGGKQAFVNGDVMDESSLISGDDSLLVCEGEPDLMTAVECGYPLSMGAPGIAQPAPGWEKHGIGSRLPIYVDRCADRLKRVRRVVVASHNDPAGWFLRNSLVSFLGVDRCAVLTWPAGFKDLNEVLLDSGPEAVRGLVDGARPVRPVDLQVPDLARWQKPAVQNPPGPVLTDRFRFEAIKRGMRPDKVDDEFRKWRDYSERHGRKHEVEIAGWRGWIDRALKFYPALKAA